MRVIKVYPVLWFRGAWKTSDGTESQPIFPWPNAKQKAIDHAIARFGDSTGEIHVYGDDGARVMETIQINGAASVTTETHSSWRLDSLEPCSSFESISAVVPVPPIGDLEASRNDPQTPYCKP